MAKTIRRTIRKFVHNITDDDIQNVLKEFPGFVRDPDWWFFGLNSPHRGHDKVRIFARRWHGEWAPPTTEEIYRLYRP